MISFKEYCGEDCESVCESLFQSSSAVDREYALEVIASLSQISDEDVTVAFSACSDCLLARIFDMGRYSFVYPIALSDSSDESAALESIREYAVKEEIPLLVTDIPSECVGELASHFRHLSLDAEDADMSSYRAEVLSEIALLPEIFSLDTGRISLTELTETDAARYAVLCRDREVNRYWGYDFREDVGDGVCDGYFISSAASEYARGTALTLGARLDGELIGDGVFYALDLSGGAEIGFRLLEKWQGQGLGRELLGAMMDYARKIGLVRLSARVKEENLRSVKLLGSVFELIEESAGQKLFKINL